ncbi:succinate dehydrogenase assembly factor 2 [Roseivivax sp. CAU 1761]
MSAAETRAVRLRRLAMRSSRRGTKEMDLILMAFVEARLGALPDEALDRYEALLEENDQDLYRWISGQEPAPSRHGASIAEITATLPGGGRAT